MKKGGRSPHQRSILNVSELVTVQNGHKATTSCKTSESTQHGAGLEESEADKKKKRKTQIMCIASKRRRDI
jgi:hypothetical protein